MRVDVAFLPQEIEGRDIGATSIVIIDVLRASTTIATAIFNGCEEVIPTSSVEEAVGIARGYEKGDFLLCGERKGKKIDGFDLGNSPSEYIPDVVGGKKLILTTTNGTAAIRSVRGAGSVFIGSFVNLDATVEKLESLGQDIIFVCAGENKRFALEDAVCAGMMVERIRAGGAEESDACLAARSIYRAYSNKIVDAFYASEHGRYLVSIGFEADLLACAQVGIIPVAACLYEGHVIREAR